MMSEGRLPRDADGGLDHRVQDQFQEYFERLVVLDYIIRNTDRGLDNCRSISHCVLTYLRYLNHLFQ
jgi:hypothetical protein